MMTKKPRVSYVGERLCFSLYACEKAIISKYLPFLKKMNMTYPQYLVYMALHEHHELAVSELGNVLYLDSGTLTPLLKRMEQGGLVTRKRCAEDERRVLVTLTDAALALEDEVARMQASVSSSVGLSKTEFVEMRENLVSLNKHLRGL